MGLGQGCRRRTTAAVALAAAVAALAVGGCGGSARPASQTRTAASARFPAYVPIGHPAGSPVGAVILIHGGGFVKTGAATMTSLVPLAQRFNAAGWETFNIDYHPLARSRQDVTRAYDAVRARVGPHVPICAMGASAGGALALLLAVDRPSLACVMSWAAPTDLTALTTPRDPVYADVRRLSASLHHNLASWSAVRVASRLHARLFLLYASNDPVVAPSQGAALNAKLPHTTFIVMPSGIAGFVHSGVDGTAFDHALRAEDGLLRSVAREGR